MIDLPVQAFSAYATIDRAPGGTRVKARVLNRWIRESVHPMLERHCRENAVQGALRFETRGEARDGKTKQEMVTVIAIGERPVTDMPAVKP